MPLIFVSFRFVFYCTENYLLGYFRITAALCAKTQLYISRFSKHLPASLRESLISKTSFWVLGLLSGLSLLIEQKHRRGELAMYVLPKGLESAWKMMRGRGWVVFVPFGESIVSRGYLFSDSAYHNVPLSYFAAVRYWNGHGHGASHH